MWDDPIVAETRSIRDEIASRFNYDVWRLGEYFKAKRATEAERLIDQAVESVTEQQPSLKQRRKPSQPASTEHGV